MSEEDVPFVLVLDCGVSDFLLGVGEGPGEFSGSGSFRRSLGFSGSIAGLTVLGTVLGDSGSGGKTSDAGRRRRMFAVVASSVTFCSITFGVEGGLIGKSGGLVFVVSVAALTRRFRGSGFFGSTFSGSSSLLNDLKPFTKHVQKIG